MNFHFSSEQTGFTPDPKNNDNSINYLRRLKAEVDADAPFTRGHRGETLACRA